MLNPGLFDVGLFVRFNINETFCRFGRNDGFNLQWLFFMLFDQKLSHQFHRTLALGTD